MSVEQRLDHIAEQLTDLIGGMAGLELRSSLVEQRLGTPDQRIAGVEQLLRPRRYMPLAEEPNR